MPELSEAGAPAELDVLQPAQPMQDEKPAPIAEQPKAGISFRDRLKSAATRFREEFGGLHKMPPEDIQDSTVAYTIWQSLHNPVSNTQPGEIPFTIRDVMANAGYVTMRRDKDLMEQFPEAYHKFRRALTDLSVQGILEMGELEEQDPDGESIAYFIPTDETGPERQEQLLDTAKQAAVINPQRYK